MTTKSSRIIDPRAGHGSDHTFEPSRAGCKELHSFPFRQDDHAFKELHTFSDAELDIVEDALRIAKAHYQSLVETVRIPGFQVQFEEQAREASELQLKIEASR